MEYAEAIRRIDTGAALMDEDRGLVESFERESRRLRAFIRRRIPDELDAEDILQDVFYELVDAYRLMRPVAHTGAWLFQVARNRIADIFRAKKSVVADSADLFLDELRAPSSDDPDQIFARQVLFSEIEAALEELPPSQREVFIAHELEGKSFKELSAQTGVGQATLLSRKHYAVRFLRRRLQKRYYEMEGKQS